MGNAVDEVKDAADAVALGVEEDGLADVLEAVLPPAEGADAEPTATSPGTASAG
jgi:hypothetical protein